MPDGLLAGLAAMASKALGKGALGALGVLGEEKPRRRRRRKALTAEDMGTVAFLASTISKRAAENFVIRRVRMG